MNPLATALLAFSMSADAFAAAIARGASSGKLRTAQVAQIALTFGIVETLTPLIGYGAGIIAAKIIPASDGKAFFLFRMPFCSLGKKVFYM